MKNIALEELLEAGCHFGHQTNRRNPKADEFIFEARSNISIIDLEKTREGLLKAGEFLSNLALKNGYVIIVGTKRQAQGIVKEEVERAQKEGVAGIFYVTSRWIGGTLTNFEEVTKNFKKLKELRSFLVSDKRQEYTKREILLIAREKQKLENLYSGVADLDRIPDALFIIDTHLEQTAVSEAIKKGVKIVGIVDTNADPQPIDYPVPANDDAVGSIKIITSFLVDAWIEGQKKSQNAALRPSSDGSKQTVKSQNEKGGEVSKEKNNTEKPQDMKDIKKKEKKAEVKRDDKSKTKEVKKEEKKKKKEIQSKDKRSKIPGLDKRSGAGKT